MVSRDHWGCSGVRNLDFDAHGGAYLLLARVVAQGSRGSYSFLRDILGPGDDHLAAFVRRRGGLADRVDHACHQIALVDQSCLDLAHGDRLASVIASAGYDHGRLVVRRVKGYCRLVDPVARLFLG